VTSRHTAQLQAIGNKGVWPFNHHYSEQLFRFHEKPIGSFCVKLLTVKHKDKC